MTELFQQHDKGLRSAGLYRVLLQTISPHCLHVTELMQTKVGQLATETALFHPTERYAGIAGAKAVDKHPAAL